MKASFFIILICSFLLSSLHAQKKHILWEKMNTPQLKDIHLISGESRNNFWLFDDTGILLNYKNGTWNSFRLPGDLKLSRFRIEKTGRERFILTGIDPGWRTHIFIFRNGRWEKEKFIINNPITNIIYYSPQLIFLTGDWASFYRYSNGGWEKIETPFKNHINSFGEKDTTIWISVRGEGIYKFKNDIFTKYEIENNIKSDFYGINAGKNGQVNFAIATGEKYKLQGNRFVIDTSAGSDASSPIIDRSMNSYRLNPIYLSFTDPGAYVPAGIILDEFIELETQEILISTKSCDLYISKTAGHNYFFDLATTYRVEGHNDSHSKGAAFFYYNEDYLPDIYVLDASETASSEFYQNSLSFPFLDITLDPGLPNFFRIENFLIGDLNGDSYNDFITMNNSRIGSEIKIFMNDTNGKFFLERILNSPEGLEQKPLTNIRLTDFYGSGNLDIDLTSYYGRNINKGSQFIIKNSGYTGPAEIDSSYSLKTRGWNAQSIFMDFNNDGINDWLIINQWQKLRLFAHTDKMPGQFIDPITFGDDSSAYMGACACDFDNDGDLDILTSSDKELISLYRNNHGKEFQNIGGQIGFTDYNLRKYSPAIRRSINCGDFNNDGFTDIFLSVNDTEYPRNYLWINDSAKYFIEMSEEYLVAQPYIAGLITGDIDSDGDIDIYGFKNGLNILWCNYQNDKNYLIIIPQGVKSNTNGIGAKVSLFRSGSNFNKDSLIGYRQIGSEEYGGNQINQTMAHFGLNSELSVDIRVEFYGGETVKLKNIKAGQTVIVREMDGIAAFLYKLPGNIIRFFMVASNQLYILIIILSVLFLFKGTRTGINKYNWSPSISISIVIINISLFWVIVLLTISSDNFWLKYALPAAVILFGVSLPLFIFYSARKYSFSGKSKEEIEEELFNKLKQFTHGEWALRNISGLQLLIQNYPSNSGELGNYVNLINERNKTFDELTFPLIEGIYSSLNNLKIEKENSAVLRNESRKIRKNIKEMISRKEPAVWQVRNLALSFLSLRNAIKEIKDNVFRFFSSEPEEVIKNLCEEFSDELKMRGIELKKYKSCDDPVKVLIKNTDLAIVLDNCIQNSIRALKNTLNPKIEIILRKKSPKILIDITDNGPGIKKELWDKIFEQGYSESGSSGSGLFNSRKVLQIYNARIFVAESAENIRTTFSIELNEGI